MKMRYSLFRHGVLLGLGLIAACSAQGPAPGGTSSFIRHAAAASFVPAAAPQIDAADTAGTADTADTADTAGTAGTADAGQGPQSAAARPDIQMPIPLDYPSQLREGRRLAAKGSWQEAAAAFAAALRAKPDDAAALSELSFAELLLNRMADAESHAKRALDRGDTPSLKAASLYNLGRIAEAQLTSKEPETVKKAADYYRQSLKLRPSEEVLSRLFQLDEAPGVLPCTEPRPFKELLACMKRILRLEDDKIETRTPVESAIYFRIKFQPEYFFYQWSNYLALRSAAGWQVVYDLGRSRHSHPHDEDIIIRKGAWGTSGSTKFLQVEYSELDVTIHHPFPVDEVPGLRELACKSDPSDCERLLDYEVDYELRHRIFFTFSEAGVPKLAGNVVVACKDSVSLTFFADSKSWPASIRRRIDQWLTAHQASSFAQPVLGPDAKLKGTELRPDDRYSGPCPKPIPRDGMRQPW